MLGGVSSPQRIHQGIGDKKNTAQPFLLTQTALDQINTVSLASDTTITGNIFNVRNDGSDKNIKDIYSNKPFDRTVQTGDIFVIRNFLNEDGQRGALDFVDVMVRREDGFNPFAGDFEYFRMGYDSMTNYAMHPNGIVPTIDNVYDRGKDVARAACVACHRNGGQDFLFTRR